VVGIIFMPVALSFAQGGSIRGNLGLETKDGRVIHGDLIIVLLVTEKFQVKKDTLFLPQFSLNLNRPTGLCPYPFF